MYDTTKVKVLILGKTGNIEVLLNTFTVSREYSVHVQKDDFGSDFEAGFFVGEFCPDVILINSEYNGINLEAMGKLRLSGNLSAILIGMGKSEPADKTASGFSDWIKDSSDTDAIMDKIEKVLSAV